MRTFSWTDYTANPRLRLYSNGLFPPNGIRKFLGPVLEWLNKTYPSADIVIRGDSGFATPELYQLAEEYEVDYVIRLKSNASLSKLSEKNEKVFQDLHGNDFTHHYAVHGEFDYMAGSWDKYRRVICRTERNAGELLTRNSFIVTSLKTDPKKIVKVYNKRGMMENFIKETKLDFGLTTLSHSSFNANHAKAMILTIAYSIMNIMKRLVLPKEFRNSRMLSLRTFIIKIACRAIRSARKTVLRFCSSYPFNQSSAQFTYFIQPKDGVKQIYICFSLHGFVYITLQTVQPSSKLN